MPTELSDFLSNSKHTTAREQMVENRFLADMAVSAAKRNYSFVIYQTSTDKDGYDVILDDRLITLPIQMKSVSGKTHSWAIHRRLMRPSLDFSAAHGITSPSLQSGLNGAVVLVKLSVREDELVHEYFYSDFLIIRAIAMGFTGARLAQRRIAITTEERLQSETKGAIRIPLSMFVRAKCTDSLLTLMGFPSIFNNLWRNHMILFLQSRRVQRASTEEELADLVFNETEARNQLAQLV
jgi:hypothetical protein